MTRSSSHIAGHRSAVPARDRWPVSDRKTSRWQPSGERSAVPQVDSAEFADAYVGSAVPQGAQGDNIGRRIMVLAGMDSVPAVTVNRFCASSLQATAMAAQAVRAGDGDAFLVAGVESTTSTPPVVESPHPAFADAARRADGIFESGQPWAD